MTSILNLPMEIFTNDICPHLSYQELQSLRLANKQLHFNTTLAFDKFKLLANENLDKFTEIFGAISPCEQDTPIKTLFERTYSTATLPDTLPGLFGPRYGNYMLAFDQEEFPSIIHEDDLFNKDRTFLQSINIFQLLKERYDFFRGLDHERNLEIISKKFTRHASILQELKSKEFSFPSTIQDLRHHARRILSIEIEQSVLIKAYEKSIKCFHSYLRKQSFVEKCLYKTISFIHSFFNPCFDVDAPYAFPPLPMSLSEYVNTTSVTISEQEREIEGQLTKIKVEAKLTMNGRNYSDSIRFNVLCGKQNEEPHSMGSFLLERLWTRLLGASRRNRVTLWGEGEETFYNYQDRDDKDAWHKKNKMRHLELKHCSFEGKQDRKILYQVLFEVFKREPVDVITVASGYRSSEILAEKKEGKIQSVFTLKEVTPIWMTAEKARASAVKWEKRIKEQPLLGSGMEPILPEYLFRNMNRII